jgi:hypothetical protein
MPDRELECRRLGTAIFRTQTKTVKKGPGFLKDQERTSYRIYCQAERTRRTNTPLACTLMGMELFGYEGGIYLGLACLVAFIFSGRGSIYSAQQIGWKKILP